jgi:hypothetical protein
VVVGCSVVAVGAVVSVGTSEVEVVLELLQAAAASRIDPSQADFRDIRSLSSMTRATVHDHPLLLMAWT